jgi:hypothetical protein
VVIGEAAEALAVIRAEVAVSVASEEGTLVEAARAATGDHDELFGKTND